MNFPAGHSAARVIPVRMGEMAVSKSPDDVFSIVGLGSCVALVLIARARRAVAMAHIVLPGSEMAPGREAPPAKFADTAVPAMLRDLRLIGVALEELEAVVIGGAMMFGQKPGSRLSGVGDRNVEAVLEVLERHNIPVVGEDVGGESGRSVQVAVADCRVLAKSGLEPPIEVGAVSPNGHVRLPRRTNVRPVVDPLAENLWQQPVEGKLTA